VHRPVKIKQLEVEGECPSALQLLWRRKYGIQYRMYRPAVKIIAAAAAAYVSFHNILPSVV